MKDGVNSANRYYLNRFRDAYRQAVIGMEKQTDIIAAYVYLSPCCPKIGLRETSESSASPCRLDDGPDSDGGSLLHLQ